MSKTLSWHTTRNHAKNMYAPIYDDEGYVHKRKLSYHKRLEFFIKMFTEFPDSILRSADKATIFINVPTINFVYTYVYLKAECLR